MLEFTKIYENLSKYENIFESMKTMQTYGNL